MSPPHLDTDVILRYLTNDPVEMAARAEVLFTALAAGKARAVLDDVVVAEAVWTLVSFYHRTRLQIHDELLPIVVLAGIENPDKPALQYALVIYRDRNVDFVDALVAAKTVHDGGHEVYSFDRDFDRIPGVARRDPGAPV